MINIKLRTVVTVAVEIESGNNTQGSSKVAGNILSAKLRDECLGMHLLL